MSDRGILVAVEGIDGAGKTTQVALLADLLRRASLDVVTSKEPTSGLWGRKIKASAAKGRLSLEEELDAFVRDRAEHVANLIQPALDAGSIVVLDRYYYSTIAYQGSRGAAVEAVKATMETRFPIPDAVYLLDIDPILSLYRIARSRGEQPNQFEQIEGLTKARVVFNSLVGERVQRIGGAMSIPAVQKQIFELFIDGPLKTKRCAKEYGCDDPFHCIFRFSGTCEWWNISRRLLVSFQAASNSPRIQT